MDDDDEIVTIRPVAGHGTDVMEVRISCPDATGLGVDIARTMLDFGLKELQGDVSTDGKWAFLIFQVRHASFTLLCFQGVRVPSLLCPASAQVGPLNFSPSSENCGFAWGICF
jgi:hypothetical protein